jgi:hypothetical protein
METKIIDTAENRENLKAIFLCFARDIAGKYDLPEVVRPLEDYEVQENQSTPGGLYAKAIQIPITPRGQMSLLVETLTVDLTVADNDGHPDTWYGRVAFHYSHHSGGSNGHNDDFTILTRKQYGTGRIYLGAVRAPLARVLENFGYDLAMRRAAEKEAEKSV